MKITVNDCLKLSAFSGAKLLACPQNAERRVRSVSVLDECDLAKGVLRNGIREQMVITHFWTSKDDVAAQIEAVNGLGANEISALVVYLKEAGCDRCGGENRPPAHHTQR